LTENSPKNLKTTKSPIPLNKPIKTKMQKITSITKIATSGSKHWEKMKKVMHNLRDGVPYLSFNSYSWDRFVLWINNRLFLFAWDLNSLNFHWRFNLSLGTIKNTTSWLHFHRTLLAFSCHIYLSINHHYFFFFIPSLSLILILSIKKPWN